MTKLAKCKDSCKIIEKSTDDLIHCLCECASNILKGNRPLSESQYEDLKKHKTNLRKLKKKNTKKTKKKILQTGDFLPALPGPIIASLFMS